MSFLAVRGLEHTYIIVCGVQRSRAVRHSTRRISIGGTGSLSVNHEDAVQHVLSA